MPLKYWVRIAVVLGLPSLGVAGWLYAGGYPIGADVPHNGFTYSVLELVRDRSIQRAAKSVVLVDDLDSPDRLLSGAADYNEMCAQCHLRPGKNESDFSLGLYPAPPNLTQVPSGNKVQEEALKRRFWVIKHGIKASGMPAWKYHHSDDRIWNMVAFIETLPSLSPEQYQILTARKQGAQEEHH